MKQKASIMRYLIVAMLTVLCAVLCFVGCKDDGQGNTDAEHTVTWDVAEHATAKAEGYDTLPTKVKDGTAIVFTIECDSGYEVDTVKRGDRNVTASNGKYTVTVTADVTISVTVKQEIKSINVTTKPTKNTYYAGETLDKAGMVVEVEYVGGSKQTLQESDYRIVYQGGAASSAFALGDTYFKVSYGGKESENVPLDAAVSVMVTLDLNGGTLAQAYQEGLKANTELSNVKLENGVLSFTYAKALTADVTLPGATDLTKGEEGDYTFVSWKLNGTGDGVSKLSKDNAVSVVYQASWNAHLFVFESIEFELQNNVPHLVVKGTYQAATSLYMLFTEGNRNISYKAEETVTGTRGQEFTLAVNLMKLTEAKAQDGGSFVGPWLDLRFGYDVDGRTETMELPYDPSLETVSMVDADETYRFGFAQYEGALKVVITMLTPYTYEMHVDNTNDVLTLTIDGQIRQKSLAALAGKTAKMDWWIASTVAAPDSKIAADGSFKFEFELSPDKGFVLDTLGYAHFSIVDENGTTVYKDGSDGNLLANERTLTNRNELTKHEIPHNDFGGNSLEISNAAGTLVYYVGIPNWDAIVIYGLNPKAPRFTSSGDVELKVDNFAAPTKVYYVIKITIENLTEEEVDKLLLGNTDGAINVFASDAARNTVTGNVYTLWFDVTAYSGSQLWPNLYFEEADGTYTKMGEFGGDGDYSTNGLYAIVGGVKYSILCGSETYSRPCLVTGTPASGETNPPETDPDYVPVVFGLTIDYTQCSLEIVNGKPVLTVKGSVQGYTSADHITFDVQVDEIWNYIIPATQSATIDASGNFTLTVDLSDIPSNTAKYLMHLQVNAQITNNSYGGSNPTYTGKGKAFDVDLSDELLTLLELADGDTLFTKTVDDKVYTIVIYGKWSRHMVALTVADAGVAVKELDKKSADLVEEGGKVYLVYKGTYDGYTEEELRALSWLGDMQENPNAGGHATGENGGWVVVRLEGTLIVNKDAKTWEYKCDVTEVAANHYTVHFSTEGKENTDFVKPGVDSSVEKTVGGKTYKLVTYKTDNNGNHYWNCYGLEITDNTVPSLVINSVNLETDEGKTKAFYVVTITVTVYTKEQLQTALQYGEDGDGKVKVGVDHIDDGENGTLKVYFDITAAPGGGAWIWSHLYVNGVSQDIKTGESAEGKTVTVGGKTYTIQNGDDKFNMDVVVVTGA